MDVSADTLHGLSLLSAARERLTQEELSSILQTVSRSLAWRSGCSPLKQQEHQEREDGSNFTRAEQKLACLSLIALLVSAARANTGLDSEVSRIKEILGDCDVDQERVDQVIAVYRREREGLQQRLFNLTIDDSEGLDAMAPAFRDIKWVQETVLKTSQLDHLASPVSRFLISIRHDAGSTDFAADIDDLQELVHSLRQCCKAIERIREEPQ